MEAPHVPGTIQFTLDGYLRCTACGGPTKRDQTRTRSKPTFGKWYYKCAPADGSKECDVMYEWHENILQQREAQGVPDPEPVSSSEFWTGTQPHPPSTPSRPRATSSSPAIVTGSQQRTTPGSSATTPLRGYYTAPVTTIQPHLLDDTPPASVAAGPVFSETSESGSSVYSGSRRAVRVPLPASVASSQSTVIEDGSDRDSSAWFTPPSQVGSRLSRSAPTIALSYRDGWEHEPGPTRSPVLMGNGLRTPTREVDLRATVDILETVTLPQIRQSLVEQEQLAIENERLQAQLQMAQERHAEMETKIEALEEDVRMLKKGQSRADKMIEGMDGSLALSMSQDEVIREENAALRSRCEEAEARYEDLNARLEKFERMFQ